MSFWSRWRTWKAARFFGALFFIAFIGWWFQQESTERLNFNNNVFSGGGSVVLFAVFTHISGHILEDDGGPAALQRDRDVSRLGVALFAESAFHGPSLVI